MTGHDLDEIRQSIARLEREKIILKYPALINWDKTTTERVEAIIEVRVTPQRDQGFDAIASRIYRYEEVRSVYLMSGGYDLCVIVEARTMRQLAFFVAEKLEVLSTNHCQLTLTLAIRNVYCACTSFSYVLLRLIRFCFFLPAAPGNQKYLLRYSRQIVVKD